MPALNEDEHLEAAVNAVRSAFEGLCPYEIIIVDDGSTDRTGELADCLAARDRGISVVHNPTNFGLGKAYWTGVELARHEYVLMVPGDDETPASTIRKVAEQQGTADLVLTFTSNGWVRSIRRRVVSNLFTGIVNTLFGLRL